MPAIDNDVVMSTSEWVNSEEVEERGAAAMMRLKCYDGAAGPRRLRGTRHRRQDRRPSDWARENDVPMFGICLGLQCAVIEFARNVCGLVESHSSEFAEESTDHVICLLDSQLQVTSKGGTMRLGAYPCVLGEGTRAREIYGVPEISERHRHRFEVNNQYRDLLSENGMTISGTSPDGGLVEMIEITEHPWFVAGQFHPELKSRPTRPHPLFASFVGAAARHARGETRAPTEETVGV